ncbi:hypothetical protein C476_13423 [Natrinema limicola JCM 13563]|uniref:Uncharacterized protein n=1 Tax=Natrinema limicola JCM 13563 TaxID=1230457 RepID=M0C8L7_9EURY|nr:hypothetical protein C476_13423 [Natrinema limicola JCM 13563]
MVRLKSDSLENVSTIAAEALECRGRQRNRTATPAGSVRVKRENPLAGVATATAPKNHTVPPPRADFKFINAKQGYRSEQSNTQIIC